ncbi:MAG: ArdC family protein [Lachnospiraceae bacterium]|nr:ArdC family protein [Lachnospiraceae bacterium]
MATKSVYEMVTERIIEQLENGFIPRQKPWTGIKSVCIQQSKQEKLFLIKSDAFKA